MASPHISARWRVGPTSYLVPPPCLIGVVVLLSSITHGIDIMKLLGPVKGIYFHLSVIFDIFSRYVTGWMVTPLESAALAQRLIAETCTTQGIGPGQLTRASPWRCYWRISG